jgi:hypothetical protein
MEGEEGGNFTYSSNYISTLLKPMLSNIKMMIAFRTNNKI